MIEIEAHRWIDSYARQHFRRGAVMDMDSAVDRMEAILRLNKLAAIDRSDLRREILLRAMHNSGAIRL